MKKAIYQIVHKQRLEQLNDEWIYDSKGIGFFSSITIVKRVIKKYKNIKGFCDYPNDFVIDKYMIDFHQKKRYDYVYVLEHFYEDEDGYDIVAKPWIFSTRSEAERYMKKMKSEIPFCNYPNNFLISKCKLNKCEWTEGFVDDIEIG